MKKTLFTAVMVLVVSLCYGQSIVRAKTLKSTDLGNQKLEVTVDGNDTTFVVIIHNGGAARHPFPVVLGGRDNAMRILGFLLDAELEDDDMIRLENPTDNYVKKNGFGGYLVFSEGRAFTGQLRKPNIRGFIKAIQEYCGGKE